VSERQLQTLPKNRATVLKSAQTISTRLTICDVVSYEDRQEPALYQTARNNQGHLQPGKESLTGKEISSRPREHLRQTEKHSVRSATGLW